MPVKSRDEGAIELQKVTTRLDEQGYEHVSDSVIYSSPFKPPVPPRMAETQFAVNPNLDNVVEHEVTVDFVYGGSYEFKEQTKDGSNQASTARDDSDEFVKVTEALKEAIYDNEIKQQRRDSSSAVKRLWMFSGLHDETYLKMGPEDCYAAWLFCDDPFCDNSDGTPIDKPRVAIVDGRGGSVSNGAMLVNGFTKSGAVVAGPSSYKATAVYGSAVVDDCELYGRTIRTTPTGCHFHGCRPFAVEVEGKELTCCETSDGERYYLTPFGLIRLSGE